MGVRQCEGKNTCRIKESSRFYCCTHKDMNPFSQLNFRAELLVYQESAGMVLVSMA